MRVSYHSTRFECSLNSSLYSSDAWDSKSQMVKPNCFSVKKESSNKINSRIVLYKSSMEDCFKYYEVNNTIPSIQELKNLFVSKVNYKDTVKDNTIEEKKGLQIRHTFWDIYDEFMNESGQKNDWTDATIEKFSALKKDLQSFDKYVCFDTFTEYGLTKFLVYLRDKKVIIPSKASADDISKIKGVRVGAMNSTIGKKFGYLKWFLNWATKKGYNKNLEYKDYRLGLKSANQQIVYLTEEEMVKIRDLKLRDDQMYLDRVRDVFRFCCFTGIRYSDAYNLRRSNVKEDHIDIITIKTTDTLSIPLSQSAKAILDKYSLTVFEDDKALPVISNQRMNVYLKELCKLAGIVTPYTTTIIKGSKRLDLVRPKYELIGTHTARRTFVSLALSKGNSAEVVMKITGHKSYSTMKPYIAIAQAAKQNAVDSLSGI